MRPMKNLLVLAMPFILLTSCGVNSGLTNQFSIHGSNTNVILDESDFVVVGEVTGSASNTYVFGFGGSKQDLIASAKRQMIANADMIGKSRAIINVTLERHKRHAPFIRKHTITVHGTIIEFK